MAVITLVAGCAQPPLLIRPGALAADPRLGAHAGRSAPVCTAASTKCAEQLRLTSGSTVSVYRNLPLAGSPAVTAAVVVVHGTGRNASGYFDRMSQAATSAGVAGRTLIAAPWFVTDEDEPSSHAARWSDDGWKAGEDSVQPKGLSSFTVMDEILATLADRSRFPNLGRITIAGHSAGGQYVQRYAAVGKAPSNLRGVAINYVVANPSSYLYPIPERPDKTGTRLVRPTTSCADYNTYKYGLENPPSYLQGESAQQILATYVSRRVSYLLGSSDTENDEHLDTDCGAQVQGKNRLQRGTFYFNWIRSAFPAAPHNLVVIPAVAHDSEGIFNSPEAKPALFGPLG